MLAHKEETFMDFTLKEDNFIFIKSSTFRNLSSQSSIYLDTVSFSGLKIINDRLKLNC